MPLSIWKPISKCATALMVEKKRRKDSPKKKKKQRRGDTHTHSTSLTNREDNIRVALEKASEDGSLTLISEDPQSLTADDNSSTVQGRARRLHALRDFLRSTALAADRSYLSPLSLPSLDESFSKFLLMYPKYKSTDRVDRLRSEEYPHLSSSSKVCLDYCGFGLFSSLNQLHGGDCFTLSELTANLGNHALYGSGGEPGTSEHGIKSRILEYLNVPENEYGLVFTVSRGSAFKLLADSYPFEPHRRRLLTMFDHESQSVNLMANSARLRGAKVDSAYFRWPTLRPCSTELRKQITGRKWRKKDSSAGLFVFPVQSRVTGARYSYQWMALAQHNGWHVLLDAGSLGPKDMDSLGLSLFRPDFIITSFYRVFGADPTGFGVLLIKKSVIGSLNNTNGRTGSGMVRIVPVFPQYLSDSVDGFDDQFLDDGVDDLDDHDESEAPAVAPTMPAFSGAFTPAEVRDVFQNEMTDPGNALDRDEMENVSIGDLMKSPVFSEDDGSSDSLLWIELGHSPYGSDPSVPKQPPPPSFDAAVLSTSQEVDSAPRENGSEKHTSFRAPRVVEVEEIEPVPEIEEEKEQEVTIPGKSNSTKGNAISRETESEFRLLDRREGKNVLAGGRLLGREEQLDQVSETTAVSRRELITSTAEEETLTDGGEDTNDWRREPEIICRHLDHVNLMGLNKSSSRLRYLVNWLVVSLIQMKHPDPSGKGGGAPLVSIYGPKIKYERGAAVAFNVKDAKRVLIDPEIVQRLAEKNGISLGVGFLTHLVVAEPPGVDVGDSHFCKPSSSSSGDRDGKNLVRVEVVTASLGFLTNFEDVYRLWAFAAKFLDPTFVQGERLPAIAEASES